MTILCYYYTHEKTMRVIKCDFVESAQEAISLVRSQFSKDIASAVMAVVK